MWGVSHCDLWARWLHNLGFIGPNPYMMGHSGISAMSIVALVFNAYSSARACRIDSSCPSASRDGRASMWLVEYGNCDLTMLSMNELVVSRGSPPNCIY